MSNRGNKKAWGLRDIPTLTHEQVVQALNDNGGNRTSAAVVLGVTCRRFMHAVRYYAAQGKEIPANRPTVIVGHEYQPTQAEIEATCAQIRATWSEAELQRRAGVNWAPFAWRVFSARRLDVSAG